jgi:hypothetical protein
LWRGWIQVWYSWYVVIPFVNGTMYPTQHNNTEKKNKRMTPSPPQKFKNKIKYFPWFCKLKEFTFYSSRVLKINVAFFYWQQILLVLYCELFPHLMKYCNTLIHVTQYRSLDWDTLNSKYGKTKERISSDEKSAFTHRMGPQYIVSWFFVIKLGSLPVSFS